MRSWLTKKTTAPPATPPTTSSPPPASRVNINIDSKEGLTISLFEFSVHSVDDGTAQIPPEQHRSLRVFLREFAADGGYIVQSCSSAAKRCGLRQFDVVQFINGVDVRNLVVTEVYQEMETTTSLDLFVVRDETAKERISTLGLGKILPIEAEEEADSVRTVQQIEQPKPEAGKTSPASTAANRSFASRMMPSVSSVTAGAKWLIGAGAAAPPDPIAPPKTWEKLPVARENVQRLQIRIERGAGEDDYELGFWLLAWTIGDILGPMRDSELGKSFSELFDFGSEGGVAVRRITVGTSSYYSGLKVWDVVQYINGKDIRKSSVGHINSLLDGCGQVLCLGVIRDLAAKRRAVSLGLCAAAGIYEDGEEETAEGNENHSASSAEQSSLTSAINTGKWLVAAPVGMVGKYAKNYLGLGGESGATDRQRYTGEESNSLLGEHVDCDDENEAVVYAEAPPPVSKGIIYSSKPKKVENKPVVSKEEESKEEQATGEQGKEEQAKGEQGKEEQAKGEQGKEEQAKGEIKEEQVKEQEDITSEPAIAATEAAKEEKPNEDDDIEILKGDRVFVCCDNARELFSICSKVSGLGWDRKMITTLGFVGIVIDTAQLGNSLVFLVRFSGFAGQFWYPIAALDLFDSDGDQKKREQVQKVVLKPSPKAGLGIVLHQERIGGGVYISHIVPGGAAANSGLMQVGDEILQIDHNNVKGLGVAHIRQQMVGDPDSCCVLGMVRRTPEGSPIEYAARLRRSLVGAEETKETAAEPNPSPTAASAAAAAPNKKRTSRRSRKGERAAAAALPSSRAGVQHIEIRIKKAKLVHEEDFESVQKMFGFELLPWTLGDLDRDLASLGMSKSMKSLLDFAVIGGGIVVYSISPGSPADIAGVRRWDVIQSLDSVDFKSFPAAEITKQFLQSKNDILIMQLMRDAHVYSRARQLGIADVVGCEVEEGETKEDADAQQNPAPEQQQQQQGNISMIQSFLWPAARIADAAGRVVHQSVSGYKNFDELDGESKIVGGLNWVIPSNISKIDVELPRVRRTGITACYWNVNEITEDYGEDLYMQLFEFARAEGGGVPIRKVETDSTGASIGLRDWDVIIEVGGIDVRHLNATGVQERLLKCGGTTINFKILRDSNILERWEQLQERREDSALMSLSVWGLLDSWKMNFSGDSSSDLDDWAGMWSSIKSYGSKKMAWMASFRSSAPQYKG